MKRWSRSLTVMTLTALCAFPAIGCGPNILRARGTVLHPLHKFTPQADVEAPRPVRKLTIVRKEQASPQHTIVGVAGRPPSLQYLKETAEMPDQTTDGSALFIDVKGIYSVYKDQMDLRKYTYWAVTSEGCRFDGEIHVMWGLKDLTVLVDGMHTEYTVVKDGGQTTAYPHVVTVQNDFSLFKRGARILLKGRDGCRITRKTKYLVFHMRGHQRERRWHYDFTFDPDKAMESSIDRGEAW